MHLPLPDEKGSGGDEHHCRDQAEHPFCIHLPVGTEQIDEYDEAHDAQQQRDGYPQQILRSPRVDVGGDEQEDQQKGYGEYETHRNPAVEVFPDPGMERVTKGENDAQERQDTGKPGWIQERIDDDGDDTEDTECSDGEEAVGKGALSLSFFYFMIRLLYRFHCGVLLLG